MTTKERMTMLQIVKQEATLYDFGISGVKDAFKKGDYVAAENAVEEWLVFNPGHVKAEQAITLYNLCHLCFDLLWVEEGVV